MFAAPYYGGGPIEDFSITSPSIDVEGYDSLILELDHLFENYIVSNTAEEQIVIEIFQNNTWQTVWQHSEFDGDFGKFYAPIHSLIDISNYTGSSIKLRFSYKNSSWGVWWVIDNVLVKGFKKKRDIASSLSQTAESYLSPNDLVHFYGNNGNVLASVQNQSNWNYGCTNVGIDRAGTTVLPFTNNNVAELITEKSWLITPQFNNPTGEYSIALYFNDTEFQNWKTATGNVDNDFTLVKTGGAIANVTPQNPFANGQTNVFATNNFLSFLANNHVKVNADFSTGFSGFAGSKSPISLPISLKSPFSAKNTSKGNLLEWTTLSEENTTFFEIERAENGFDFKKITTLLAQGNSSAEVKYEFADNEYEEAINYYRFKQMDNDGKFFYSNIAIVDNTIAKSTIEMHTFNNELFIDFNEFVDDCTVSVFDLNGKLVQSTNINDSYTIINLQHLTSGGYFVSIVSPMFTDIKKIAIN